jgi:hypothetical protein
MKSPKKLDQQSAMKSDHVLTLAYPQLWPGLLLQMLAVHLDMVLHKLDIPRRFGEKSKLPPQRPRLTQKSP